MPGFRALRVRGALPPVLVHFIGLIKKGSLRRICAKALTEDCRIEIDSNVSVLLPQRLQHVVRKVAPVAAKASAAGMACNNWSLGKLYAVPESLVRGMRKVYHHAQLVHFRNNLPSKGAKAIPFLTLRGGIGNGVVSVVRKRNIAHSKAVESPKERQILLDWGTVLHTYKYGNNAVLAVFSGFLRAEGNCRKL